MPLVVSSLITLILFGLNKFKCKFIGVSCSSLVGYLLCVISGIFGRFMINKPHILLSLQHIRFFTVVSTVVRVIHVSFKHNLVFYTSREEPVDPVRDLTTNVFAELNPLIVKRREEASILQGYLNLYVQIHNVES